LTSALAVAEWSASRPGRFTPEERAPGTYWIRSIVDPTASLEDVEKRKLLTLPESNSDPSIDQPVASQYKENSISEINLGKECFQNKRRMHNFYNKSNTEIK
jgi:hypothetical protein